MNSWSPELTEQTREAIDDLINGYFTGAKCHMKREKNGGREFGFIENDPILLSKPKLEEIVIHGTDSDQQWKYKTIDDLINDGWAVD